MKRYQTYFLLFPTLEINLMSIIYHYNFHEFILFLLLSNLFRATSKQGEDLEMIQES